jgi:uncharacterized RDD family membrane protein YckC
MSEFGIYTAQNVTIDYKLAGLGDRIAAFVIDSLIMVAYVISVLLLVSAFGQMGIVFQVIVFLPTLLYHLLFEVFMNGQTPGKRQMGIQVKMADGSVPGIGAYLLRWLLSPIDFVMSGGIAMASIIISAKSQRLGDLAAGTVVTKIKALDRFNKDFLTRNVDDTYEPVFDLVKYKINQKDIDLIKEALRVRIANSTYQPSEKLRKQLETRLEVTSDLSTVAFLHTVIKDFEYFQR